ncbi:MAG: pentapeptide repeat-containing protein [Pseudonocardiaceae bacterium]
MIEDVTENAERQPKPKPGRPLSIRAIVIGGVLMGLVGAAAIVALLHFYGGGTDRDKAGLDVVRTAGTLLVGTGGAIALLLTARRQRSTELTLEHQRAVAAANERDTAEQRLTELYTRAVDQLGNGQAPVRLGGLYALERLAQKNPDQRQTIVDVICAYLRMPYTPPDDKPPADDAPVETHTRYEQRRQELQVRVTAQRILKAHLQAKDAPDKFWPDIDLNLSEAYLHQFSLQNCHIRQAYFGKAQFSQPAVFDGAQFDKDALFNDARFDGLTLFTAAQFGEHVAFTRAQCDGEIYFYEAQFRSYATFVGTKFNGKVRFERVQFSDITDFRHAQFNEPAEFDGARARVLPRRPHSWPTGWTTRDAAEGEEEGWSYLGRVEEATE